MKPLELPPELIEANRCQLDMFGALANATFSGTQRMLRLGFELAEAMLADSTRQAEDLAAGRSQRHATPPESVTLSLRLPLQLMDAGLDASRDVLEICAGDMQKQCALMTRLAQRTAGSQGSYDFAPALQATLASMQALFDGATAPVRAARPGNGAHPGNGKNPAQRPTA